MASDPLRLRLENAPAELAETMLRIGRMASARIAGRAIGTYMQEADPSPRRRGEGGPLRISTGRLARSIAVARGRDEDTGGQPEGIFELEVNGSVMTLTKGSRVPYAAIHEKGGTIHAKSAPFLRFRTADGWRSAKSVRIPARPYLAPALEHETPWIQDMTVSEIRILILTLFGDPPSGGTSS